ncbi:MAG: carotenoid biosynthesis protein [Bacteroidia bacterium]
MQFPILSERFIRPAQLVLVVFYAVGLLGIIFKPEIFLPLSPLNLVLNFTLILLLQKDVDGDFWRYLIFVVAGGIGVELMGVKTGAIFGAYHYGDSLGWKLNTVPFIIGINWFILSWTALAVAERIATSMYVRSLAGAAIMTLLDLLIEQVCQQLDFWHWDLGYAPLRNYIAWFVISFFFQLMGQQMRLHRQHPLAIIILVLQFVFFLVLNLVNKIA